MSDHPTKTGKPLGLHTLAGALLGAGFIWLWECHPLVITAAFAGLFVLGTLLLILIGLLTPPRPPTVADRLRDAVLLGLVIGLLTGSFLGHEKPDDDPRR